MPRRWAAWRDRETFMRVLLSGAGVQCPVCGTWYSRALLVPGGACGDLSQGQLEPCRGRVVAVPRGAATGRKEDAV